MSQTTTQTKMTSVKGKASSSGKSKSEGKVKEMSQFHKQQTAWAEYIRRLRRDLERVRPIVDDRPPRLNVSMMYDSESLRKNYKAAMNRFNINPEVLKYLHEMNVMGGKTDTFAPRKTLPPLSNFNDRRAHARSIEKSNVLLKQLIEKTGPRLPTAREYAAEWKKMEAFIEFMSQFPLFWKVKRKRKEKILVAPSRTYFKQYVTEKSAKYPDKRPRVFFEISIKNIGSIGKMVAVLYSDYVPMTVKNFLAFCDSKTELTYKGCLFYFIFQNFFCQTGDVVENKGFGGTSIYGPYFGDEDHTLQHGDRGILTMFNTIPNRNQSQFLITFRELKTLNGMNVAFGRIIRGFHVLEAIESVGSKSTGRPRVEIYISDCDEI